MSATTRTKTNTSYYVVRASAISTRDSNAGELITIGWGLWCGMGGWSQPAWEEGSGRPIKDLADAQNIANTLCHGSMWGFKVVPSSAKVFKIDTTTITYVTEQEID